MNIIIQSQEYQANIREYGFVQMTISWKRKDAGSVVYIGSQFLTILNLKNMVCGGVIL